MRSEPEPLLAGLDVVEFKRNLQEMKADVQESIKEDPEYNGEADLLLNTIANLQDELANVKEIKNLEGRKQARILADIALLSSLTKSMMGDEHDDDCCEHGTCHDGDDDFYEEEEDAEER